MGFLNRNWFMLLCGVLGVAGVVLMVVVSGKMSVIQDEMSKSASLYNDLGRAPLANASTIAAVARTTETARERYETVIKLAIETNRREPLRSDVFPRIAQPGAQFSFQKDYQNVFDKLARQLNPKADQSKFTQFDLPDDKEIAQWAAELQRRAEEENLQAGAPGTPGNRPAGGAAPRPGDLRRSGGFRGRPGAQAGGAGGQALTPEEAAANNPATLASIAKARGIYCYVGVDSFQRHDIFFASGSIDEAAMWAAQVALWVQQDVVTALAAVNSQAAALIEARNQVAGNGGSQPQRIDVSTMPVKHLQSIALTAKGDVYLSLGGAPGAGGPGGGPGGPVGGIPAPQVAAGPGPGLSFTERQGNELFDVVPFQVKLICDQRDLPQIIDEVAKVNFYTLVNVSYDRAAMGGGTRAAASMRGAAEYLYGHEPVVLAVLDFEGYFFREAYHYRRPDQPATQPKPDDADSPMTDEDSLDKYPFMPENVRTLVANGMGMMSLHKGFPSARDQGGGRGPAPRRPQTPLGN